MNPGRVVQCISLMKSRKCEIVKVLQEHGNVNLFLHVCAKK